MPVIQDEAMKRVNIFHRAHEKKYVNIKGLLKTLLFQNSEKDSLLGPMVQEKIAFQIFKKEGFF